MQLKVWVLACVSTTLVAPLKHPALVYESGTVESRVRQLAHCKIHGMVDVSLEHCCLS